MCICAYSSTCYIDETRRLHVESTPLRMPKPIVQSPRLGYLALSLRVRHEPTCNPHVPIVVPNDRCFLVFGFLRMLVEQRSPSLLFLPRQ